MCSKLWLQCIRQVDIQQQDFVSFQHTSAPAATVNDITLEFKLFWAQITVSNTIHGDKGREGGGERDFQLYVKLRESSSQFYFSSSNDMQQLLCSCNLFLNHKCLQCDPTTSMIKCIKTINTWLDAVSYTNYFSETTSWNGSI